MHLLGHEQPPALQDARHGVPLAAGEVRLAVRPLEEVGVGDAAADEGADEGVGQPPTGKEGQVGSQVVEPDNKAYV